MTATAIAFAADPALSFFPTPPDVADDLVMRTLCPGFGQGEAAGGVPQVRVLEPSAGDGHLARAVRDHLPYAHITCVEPSPARAGTLRMQDGLADEVVESTLEDYLASTGWWVAAGLSLPEPRTGATFAAHEDEVEEQTMKVLYARYKVAGWPLAVVTGPQAEEN